MKKERNSSFELLRLLCIFGITVMHSFGRIDTSGSLLNTELHVLFNALFNTGVTCFILISGYFGIRLDVKKLIRMDLMVIFFTLCGTVLLGEFGVKSLIKACIPVISRRYWFITCYFALCILSPFLNQIPQRLDRAGFKRLLLVMLAVFSVIPTFTTYDIMQDAGKGLVNFIMIYLIGRYLARYKTEHYEKKKLHLGFFCCILLIFLLDSALTLSNGVLYSTFARDCSIFIIFAAVLLLLSFREIHFSSRAVNRIAGNVLAVTVLDSFLQQFLTRFFDLSVYGLHPLLGVFVLVYALAVVALGVLANELRKCTVGRIEPWLVEKLAAVWEKLYPAALRLADQILGKFIKPIS